MSESNVQLPPNSTGQQLRILTGDSTSQIPAGTGEEVVVVSDSMGLFPGDGRMRSGPVTEQTMQEVLTELRRHTMLLSIAFGCEIPSLGDALNLGG